MFFKKDLIDLSKRRANVYKILIFFSALQKKTLALE